MSVIENNKDEFVYNLMKKGLDASSLRSKITANNIANVNTMGFKRSFVTFEDSLNQSMDNIEMKRTDERHYNDGTVSGESQVKTDSSTSMKNDGNNVDIDSEEANQASNTLMFNALTTMVNNRMSMERYVISGGGR